MKWLIAVLVILTTLAILSTRPAPADAAPKPKCGMRAEMVDAMSRKYSERQIGLGVVGGGQAIIEIFASPEGGWTAIISHPNGTACILAVGTDWRQSPQGDPA